MLKANFKDLFDIVTPVYPKIWNKIHNNCAINILNGNPSMQTTRYDKIHRWNFDETPQNFATSK